MEKTKPLYYNSMEDEQSTAIDFQQSGNHAINSTPFAAHTEHAHAKRSSLAFSDIVYTVPTGWIWKRENKIILNSVR